MDKKTVLILITLGFLLLNCYPSEDCIDGLNLLPMYGKQKKCKQQIEIDNDFLSECDQKFTNRKVAAEFYKSKGWEYFYKNDLETSMKRFNQAWLLDSLNSETYWGFGNILGLKHKFEESIPYLEKSIKLNSINPKVFESISTSYGQIFFQTKNINDLNTSIKYLKKSIELDPKNARAYGQLTASYCYFMQRDSALKYYKITERLDPSAINPEVRKILNK